MAIATGNSGGSRGQSNGLAPYYERLEPLAGGYELTRADGQPLGQIRVFDDREELNVIHVQFSAGRGKWTKVSTFRAGSLADFRDIIAALELAANEMDKPPF